LYLGGFVPDVVLAPLAQSLFVHNRDVDEFETNRRLKRIQAFKEEEMPTKTKEDLEASIENSLHLKEQENLIALCENECKAILELVDSDVLGVSHSSPNTVCACSRTRHVCTCLFMQD